MNTSDAGHRSVFVEDAFQRIHQRLKERLRSAGWGAVKRTEEALGMQPGYFRQRRYENKLSLEVLLQTLEILEVEPADFFADVFGSSEDPYYWHAIEREIVPEDVDDPVVRSAIERRLRKG